MVLARPPTTTPGTGRHTGRVRVDGKQFRVAGDRFPFRGVTYGTFRPRAVDGARFPDRTDIKLDFEAMSDAGFTVVRTYTPPTRDLLDAADEWDLRVLAGAFWPDWRYLLGASRRQAARVERDAERTIGTIARALAGDERVLALALGNEVPADVVRWYGADRVAKVIARLAEVVREEDPEQLVTYANYPSAEYLPLHSLDFLTFNVFLERGEDLRRYLTRLHHLAGDRPLVLGEVGLHVNATGGEDAQARFLDEQLRIASERGVAGTCTFSWTDDWWVGDAPVEGWSFGLTRADRSPRPALDVVAHHNRTALADLADEWPSMTVVVCAYNAAETLDECLAHACALDYPGLEIVVVDDGSTDATAAIAGCHPRARLVSIPHGGLSVARNEGFRAANGEIVAYLDADAFPTPEWPYYLALGFDSRSVGGVGGPNVPPNDDPIGAQVVAQSPGGPVHVLVSDDRAEHIPGCNMAFWKDVLEEVGGFDPVYTSAGDDVDVCWKVLDRGWEIGFHPAALVWHHRRPGLRTYLRQQRGYGRAEALVESRHPDRFTPLGTARWRGRIYTALPPVGRRQSVYHGAFGAAAYQSVYGGGGHLVDVAHQVGVPLAATSVAAMPLAIANPALVALTLIGLAYLLALGALDAHRARPPRTMHTGRGWFRLAVAAHHILQPIVRLWGRHRTVLNGQHRLSPAEIELTGPMTVQRGGVLLLPEAAPRPTIAASIVDALRRAGIRVAPGSEWDDHDARLVGSSLLIGRLVTSSHPEGSVQVRVRRRLIPHRAAITGVVAGGALLLGPAFGLAVGSAVGIDLSMGWWRTGPLVRRTVERATQ